MLTISPGHSAGYLTSQVGAGMEGYYTGAVGAGEPPGTWWGDGAKALGLEGVVDEETMHAVFEDFLDPRDPRFADPSTRAESARLGRGPKQFRTPDEVVAGRIREYTQEHASTPIPEQIHAWRVDAEQRTNRAVYFFDATFSPVKSVTVAHAAFSRAAHEAEATGDYEAAAQWRDRVERIDRAIASANASMLTYLADEGGYARTGRHTGKSGTGRWVDGHGVTVASFYQHTSRDHDPQLHVHNAVLNRVECPGGKWRSLDGRALHAVIQGAGAIGSAVLQTELSRELGVEWVLREDGNDFEIAGIDSEVMDLFSSRTRTLTAKGQALIARAEEQLGAPLNSLQRARLMKEASLSTRAAKTHTSESEAERLDRWHAQLQSTVVGGLTRTAHQLVDQITARQASGRPAHVLFSPQAVIAQALEAVHGADEGTGRSVWSESDLLRRIHLALPAELDLDPAERVTLLKALAADAVQQAVQVSGREVGDVPCPDRLDNGLSAAAAPYERRYATPGHIAAEVALLEASGVRGRQALSTDHIQAWLGDADNAATLNDAQRAAIAGLASSDAALAVLVGPAGTGKSHTAGVLATAWSDLTTAQGTPGRVIGLATAENAAQILADDGLTDSANIAAFLAAQRRLAEGRGLDGDDRWRLSGRDLLVVDEASMLDTYRLAALQKAAGQAGARIVLMGDPHQLAAVGAGGMMRTAIDHGAETYTLTDVRRFTAEWERAASLELRDGNTAAVLAYDRHGRLRDAGTLDDAIAAVARAAAADRLAGRDVLVTCGSNENAAAVCAAVRRQLVSAGVVDEGGVVLGRDGTTAGVGDVVQARRIDRALGLVNRQTYTVAAVNDDGSLAVTSTRDGAHHVIPADYVGADLTLGYASTAHAAQGATVDAGHLLLTPGLDRAATYVGLTRGRDDNTAWAVTVDTTDPKAPPTTARGILDGLLELDAEALAARDASATEVAVTDEAHRYNPATLLARIEEQTQLAARERLENDLDTLVSDGDLDEATRARFTAEQGTEHLARQLRALETAGHEPLGVLREAVTRRGYHDAVSVSQATADRIERAHGLPVPVREVISPQRISPSRAEYLDSLHAVLAERQDAQGQQLAVQSPAWAVEALGTVPAESDAAAHAEWAAKAGRIAAVRAATGWDHPEIALGRAPGVSTPERRAAWGQAWVAAGMPLEKRPAADLSEGQLRARVAAGERINAHAPAAAYEQQRNYEQRVADLAHKVTLSRAAGDDVQALRHEAELDVATEDAERLDLTNTVRAEWLIAHAETLRAADEAREEATRRGVTLDHEPDRVTAEEWLAAHREATRADDAHRTITDADVDDRPADLSHARTADEAAAVVADETAESESTSQAEVLDDAETRRTPKVSDLASDAVADVPSAEALAAEIAAAAAHARAAQNQLADQASEEAAHAEAEHLVDATEDTAVDAAGADDDWHWRTRLADTNADLGDSTHAELASDTGLDSAADDGYADGLD